MEAQEIARRMRQILLGASLSFGLTGTVLFGSVARGEASSDSDVDLLLVGRGIPPQRHRRSREIVEIKRLLPGVPLDILLMTANEAQSNFRNHNPLFLDIAEDGIVLLDPDGLLSDFIHATLRYVRDRGIERVDGRWRFPVERGAPTYLSKVSNSDYSRAMLNDAGRDHCVAQRLVEDAFYDKAVYHFQQAAEKSEKAVVIALGIFRKIHLVGAVLRGVCGEESVPREWVGPFLHVANLSEEMGADLSLSRYPGIVDDALWVPAEEYSLDDAQAAWIKSAETLQVAERFVREWFSNETAGPGMGGP